MLMHMNPSANATLPESFASRSFFGGLGGVGKSTCPAHAAAVTAMIDFAPW